MQGLGTVKSYKSQISLFAAIGIFLFANLYFTFHYQNYFSLIEKGCIYEATKTALSSVATKQKNDNPVHTAVFRQSSIAIYLPALNTTVHKRERLYISRNLHPFSNKAPPVQS